ncbi:hypothetical protein AKO1_010578 [Acrasis kona]|uniref:Protein kinase domain-containing protein n=1 Tax=Acrasis kona TaxID=1008807 RepID=A0AAW2ZKB7_9EUKA
MRSNRNDHCDKIFTFAACTLLMVIAIMSNIALGTYGIVSHTRFEFNETLVKEKEGNTTNITFLVSELKLWNILLVVFDYSSAIVGIICMLLFLTVRDTTAHKIATIIMFNLLLYTVSLGLPSGLFVYFPLHELEKHARFDNLDFNKQPAAPMYLLCIFSKAVMYVLFLLIFSVVMGKYIKRCPPSVRQVLQAKKYFNIIGLFMISIFYVLSGSIDYFLASRGLIAIYDEKEGYFYRIEISFLFTRGLLSFICAVTHFLLAIFSLVWFRSGLPTYNLLRKVSAGLCVTSTVASCVLSFVQVAYSIVHSNESEKQSYMKWAVVCVFEFPRLTVFVEIIISWVVIQMVMNVSLSYSYSDFVARNPEMDLNEPLLKDDIKRSSFVYDIQNWIVEAHELTFDSKISEGTFGVVFAGKYLGSKVAIKMMKRQESEMEFEHEVRMLIMLRHPNIVLFMGACIAKDYKYIVTEIMSTNLHDVVHRRSEKHDKSGRHAALTLDKKIQILKDVASALAFMNGRENPICHRDLKPSNILLNSSLTVAKLCDLGSSRNVSNEMTSNTGTFTYMSPEMLFGQRYTEKSDVYSFAIVMFEVFFERRPFASEESGSNDFLVSMNVTKGERPKMPQDIENVTEKETLYLKLMNKSWSHDPNYRPSFSEISSTLEQLADVN